MRDPEPGDIVAAKRFGWDEQLSAVEEFDREPYYESGYESDDIEGELAIIKTESFTAYLVGGQEADGKTIRLKDSVSECGGEGGQPGPCPTGKQASGQLDIRVSQAQSLGGKLTGAAKAAAGKVGGYLKGQYQKLADRYGPKAAMAMGGAMILTFPIPGNIAAIVGAVEAYRWLRGSSGGKGPVREAEASIDAMVGDFRAMLADVAKTAGVQAPELSDSAIAELISAQMSHDHGDQPTTEAVAPVLLDVPDVRQQTDYSCGAAALASVLQHHGIDFDEAELREILGSDPQDGTTIPAIAGFAARQGLAVTMARMDLAKLRGHLEAGRAVIAPIQADDPAANTGGHYVVVIGHGGGKLTLQDPMAGRGEIDEAAFDRRWHDVDKTLRQVDHYGIAVGKE